MLYKVATDGMPLLTPVQRNGRHQNEGMDTVKDTVNCQAWTLSKPKHLAVLTANCRPYCFFFNDSSRESSYEGGGFQEKEEEEEEEEEEEDNRRACQFPPIINTSRFLPPLRNR